MERQFHGSEDLLLLKGAGLIPGPVQVFTPMPTVAPGRLKVFSGLCALVHLCLTHRQTDRQTGKLKKEKLHDLLAFWMRK